MFNKNTYNVDVNLGITSNQKSSFLQDDISTRLQFNKLSIQTLGNETNEQLGHLPSHFLEIIVG